MMLCVWISLTPAQAQDESPVNVTLSSFAVFPLDNAVRIEWATDTEIDLAGFFLQRAENNGPFIGLDNIGFIPGTGGDVTGDNYMAVDNTAVNGSTYTYKLFELETNGNERALAEETVTLTGPPPTPAPIGGGPGPIPTSTPLVNVTVPVSTATARPGNTATPTPTATSGAAVATPTTAPPATATNEPLPSPTPPAATAIISLPPATLLPTPTPLMFPTATAVSTDTVTLPDESSVTQFLTPIAVNTSTPIPANNVVLAQSADTLAAAVPIVSQPTTAAQTAVPAQVDDASAATIGRGRLLLWISFLAAALVFIISIIGSILLFTRKQEHNHNQT